MEHTVEGSRRIYGGAKDNKAEDNRPKNKW